MNSIIELMTNNGYKCICSTDNSAWSLQKNNTRIDIVQYDHEIIVYQNGDQIKKICKTIDEVKKLIL